MPEPSPLPPIKNPGNSQSASYAAVPPIPDLFASPTFPTEAKPKKRKRTKGCLTAFVIILILVLFSSLPFLIIPYLRTQDDSKLPINSTESSSEQAAPETTESNTAAKVTIKEQVLFNNKSIRITATGFEESGIFGAGINIIAENNSDKNITIQTRSCSVNGIMTDTVFSCDVAAGKKANDSITLSASDLKMAQITTIKDIEFSFHIFDTDSWEEIADSEKIKLSTSADSSYIQKHDDSGYTAFEDSIIKIVVKKLNSSDSFWGSDVYLYIENKSDQSFTVQTDDVSINGFMVEPAFSCEVDAGKSAYDTITFFESDLEKNKITDINEIELKFHIFDTASWETVKDTDKIIIKF